jgi:DNA-binding NarL/FixJ family response regulator
MRAEPRHEQCHDLSRLSLVLMTAVFVLRSDPHAAARLHALLESTPRLRVAGLARYAFRACQLLPGSGTELLISDLRLHDGSALSVLDELRNATAMTSAALPKLLVLAHAVDDALLLDALRAGADGYHIEDDPARSLGMSIAETMRDEAVMAPAIARQVLGWFSAGGARPAPLQLSDADRELLLRIGHGQLPGEIARARPGATASDVRRHIRCIYRKMQWASTVVGRAA